MRSAGFHETKLQGLFAREFGDTMVYIFTDNDILLRKEIKIPLKGRDLDSVYKDFGDYRFLLVKNSLDGIIKASIIDKSGGKKYSIYVNSKEIVLVEWFSQAPYNSGPAVVDSSVDTNDNRSSK